MPDAKDPKFALFELYVATAEKVSDRRAQANAWMLSVNSAVVALYGYLLADKPVVDAAQKSVWLWTIPAAGIIVCAAWVTLLTSYRKLNSAKFTVIMELENDLPLAPFTREREIYKRARRRSLSYIETAIPLCFILLYAAILAAAIVLRATPSSPPHA